MTATPLIKRQAVRIAILGGVAVLGVKLLGYFLTNSVGVLSDALESTINVAAAALAAWAISVSMQPPDDSHPYGHDKAEYLSSILEGILIGIAAMLIIVAARDRLMHPQEIHLTWPGLLVNVAASGINLALGRYLVAVGQQTHSMALEADGKHVLADVVTSVGVLGGVILAVMTKLTWLDPAIAILVALNVLRTGVELVQRSIRVLMDAAIPETDLQAIHAVLETYRSRYLEVHDLRTRASGARRFVDFHLILPSSTTVQTSHDLCDEIEQAIQAQIPNASVTIHVEPPAFRQTARR